MTEAKQNLDNVTYRADGALRFTNRKYYEQGNKASRLLAFLLRKAQSSRVILQIKHPITVQLTSQPKEIADAFAAYYTNLYDSPKLDGKIETIQEFLRPLNMT